ncbi:MAG: glycosyltransferase family 2 protein, partial [Nocardioidaceae bacterium]
MDRQAISCDVVLPCRDEAAALPKVLAGLPTGYTAIVVDNGSTDRTGELARSLGATVVREDRIGYGAAVHTGVLAATAHLIAVVDGDGSMDLADLVPLTAMVSRGEVTMAVGRRRPTGRGVWPWHARLGTYLVLRR